MDTKPLRHPSDTGAPCAHDRRAVIIGAYGYDVGVCMPEGPSYEWWERFEWCIACGELLAGGPVGYERGDEPDAPGVPVVGPKGTE